ncbi:MAG TPA: STAS domain-containing protein [Streptosporangiaceae bacterium]
MTEPGPAGQFSRSGPQDGELTPRFDVEPGTGGQPPTVRAAGDIDLNSAPRFQAALTEAAGSSGPVTADLTAVTYCDSAAIHVLLTLARDHHLTLVVQADGPTTTMLKIAGLDQVATVRAEP